MTLNSLLATTNSYKMSENSTFSEDVLYIAIYLFMCVCCMYVYVSMGACVHGNKRTIYKFFESSIFQVDISSHFSNKQNRVMITTSLISSLTHLQG